MKLLDSILEKVIPVLMIGLAGGLLVMYADVAGLKIKSTHAKDRIDKIETKIDKIYQYIIKKGK